MGYCVFVLSPFLIIIAVVHATVENHKLGPMLTTLTRNATHQTYCLPVKTSPINTHPQMQEDHHLPGDPQRPLSHTRLSSHLTANSNSNNSFFPKRSILTERRQQWEEPMETTRAIVYSN